MTGGKQIGREPGGPPPGALLLILSLFMLLPPMVMMLVVWLETGVWWRFAVVVTLSMGLIYWQMFRIFRAQDRRAIQELISS